MRPLSAALVVLVCFGAAGRAQQQPPSPGAAAPVRDPKADAVLKQMGDALAAARALSFDAQTETEQVLSTGGKIEFARRIKASLRRPDRLAATVDGDVDDLRFVCDDKTATLYNPTAKAYATVPAAGNLDATLDLLAGKYGIAMPLADLVFSDPYKTLTEHVAESHYLGIGYVMDAKCHHLAFVQDNIDWQIWVEDAPTPLPRKVVITYKRLPSQPRYAAYLSNWNLRADLPDATFAFTPPAGAKRVEMANPAPTTRPAPAPAIPASARDSS